MKKITFFSIIFIYIIGFLLILYYIYTANQNQEKGWIEVFSVILSIYLGLGILIFKKIKIKMESYMESLSNFETNNFKILIYGIGRGGKSTTIKSLIMVDSFDSKNEKTTEEFVIHKRKKILQNNKEYEVAIADYRGQKPSEIVSSVDEKIDFFGEKNRRKINSIIFIADLFREEEDAERNIIDDTQILARFEKNRETIETSINEQREKNLRYLNKNTLEPIFSICLSKPNNPATQELYSVRLLINKADLLDHLIENKSLFTDKNVFHYCIDLYSELIKVIARFCDENKIPNFLVYVISAKDEVFYDTNGKRNNIKKILGEMLVFHNMIRK